MRILLKLSGEALAGDKKTGFDEETVRKVALQVKGLVDQGIQVGIVTGGGNFWRGRTSENIDRTKADQIGMLATVMNCIYVSEIFRSVGMMTNILQTIMGHSDVSTTLRYYVKSTDEQASKELKKFKDYMEEICLSING